MFLNNPLHAFQVHGYEERLVQLEQGDLFSEYFQNLKVTFILSFHCLLNIFLCNLLSWQESAEQKEEIAALKTTVASMRGWPSNSWYPTYSPSPNNV